MRKIYIVGIALLVISLLALRPVPPFRLEGRRPGNNLTRMGRVAGWDLA